MHKNQKNHLLSQIKPCILNQSENVPIRQCTAPARNIFAKQPLENAGTWQGERKQSLVPLRLRRAEEISTGYFFRHAWQARLRANIFRAGASPHQSKKHSPNSREPLYNRD